MKSATPPRVLNIPFMYRKSHESFSEETSTPNFLILLHNDSVYQRCGPGVWLALRLNQSSIANFWLFLAIFGPCSNLTPQQFIYVQEEWNSDWFHLFFSPGTTIKTFTDRRQTFFPFSFVFLVCSFFSKVCMCLFGWDRREASEEASLCYLCLRHMCREGAACTISRPSAVEACLLPPSRSPTKQSLKNGWME